MQETLAIERLTEIYELSLSLAVSISLKPFEKSKQI